MFDIIRFKTDINPVARIDCKTSRPTKIWSQHFKIWIGQVSFFRDSIKVYTSVPVVDYYALHEVICLIRVVRVRVAQDNLYFFVLQPKVKENPKLILVFGKNTIVLVDIDSNSLVHVEFGLFPLANLFPSDFSFGLELYIFTKKIQHKARTVHVLYILECFDFCESIRRSIRYNIRREDHTAQKS